MSYSTSIYCTTSCAWFLLFPITRETEAQLQRQAQVGTFKLTRVYRKKNEPQIQMTALETTLSINQLLNIFIYLAFLTDHASINRLSVYLMQYLRYTKQVKYSSM